MRQSPKMEATGQLTEGMAHDFNNLPTPIIGSLDRLVTRGLGSERERERGLRAGAIESAERAKTLVQRLLAFARRRPPRPVAVDAGALVAGRAGPVRSTLGSRVDLRVDVPPGLSPAHADANQLEMALLNLAANARDAMPEGRQLAIAATPGGVRAPHPAGLERGHYVRLSMADAGTGMDEPTLARAVQPLFSTKGVGRGTGPGRHRRAVASGQRRGAGRGRGRPRPPRARHATRTRAPRGRRGPRAHEHGRHAGGPRVRGAGGGLGRRGAGAPAGGARAWTSWSPTTSCRA